MTCILLDIPWGSLVSTVLLVILVFAGTRGTFSMRNSGRWLFFLHTW
uniref:Uncharacterized protein n=1 Tax=Manihot esculenta TaxID=3983 RepID=A0A2C9WQ04_MANES